MSYQLHPALHYPSPAKRALLTALQSMTDAFLTNPTNLMISLACQPIHPPSKQSIVESSPLMPIQPIWLLWQLDWPAPPSLPQQAATAWCPCFSSQNDATPSSLSKKESQMCLHSSTIPHWLDGQCRWPILYNLKLILRHMHNCLLSSIALKYTVQYWWVLIALRINVS